MELLSMSGGFNPMMMGMGMPPGGMGGMDPYGGMGGGLGGGMGGGMGGFPGLYGPPGGIWVQ